MVREALTGYWSLVSGLTEVTVERARAAARAALAQGEATREQVSGLAQEITEASRSNREALLKLVRYEAERAAGRLGFASTDEVTTLQGRVRELERSIAALRAAADEVAPRVTAAAADRPVRAAEPVAGPAAGPAEPGAGPAGPGAAEPGAAEPAAPVPATKAAGKKAPGRAAERKATKSPAGAAAKKAAKAAEPPVEAGKAAEPPAKAGKATKAPAKAAKAPGKAAKAPAKAAKAAKAPAKAPAKKAAKAAPSAAGSQG